MALPPWLVTYGWPLVISIVSAAVEFRLSLRGQRKAREAEEEREQQKQAEVDEEVSRMLCESILRNLNGISPRVANHRESDIETPLEFDGIDTTIWEAVKEDLLSGNLDLDTKMDFTNAFGGLEQLRRMSEEARSAFKRAQTTEDPDEARFAQADFYRSQGHLHLYSYIVQTLAELIIEEHGTDGQRQRLQDLFEKHGHPSEPAAPSTTAG